ncbi:MAG: AraC family transcriptional regulator [Rhodobacteraceae bacterium]|nr:AraC family transcriptional regulator [Paracoccaceae bacterium]
MPTLPIPAFGGLVLAFLALRTLLQGGRRLMALFLALCALQSLGLTLAGGYGIAVLRPLMPVTAAMIPPLAWITFRAALFHTPRLAESLPHLCAPLFVLFCRVFAPVTVDAVVSLTFACYGAMILWRLARAGDLPLARLEAGGLPALMWKGLAWALIGSALCDILIAAAYATGHADRAGLVLGIGSTATLLTLGLLGATPSASGEDEPEEAPEGPVPSPETEAEDAAICARLDAFLDREKWHLDAGLTLARLARRLHLPEKRLSAAVNRATAGNVSRHINGWRIRHACGLIDKGVPITTAMLDSGFNTKSNFNREFLRVTGTVPSQWLRSR